MLRHAVLDQPNDRSSHTVPTPRGGGLAVLFVFLTALVVLIMAGSLSQSITIGVLGGTVLLGALSWMDDVFGLSTILRLLVHIVCVTAALMFGLIEGPVFGGLLPPLIDTIAAGLIWIWFINLFNFMDGIDGITGVETISICAGVVVLAGLKSGGVNSHLTGDLGLIALLLGGCMAGFLVLNWHPAKIFLGDVGSVPLGFVLGWLLLSLAAEGYWIAALILPLYYVVDASFTLLKRILRGEKPWQAHREHFYQYAVQNGKSHAEVSTAIAIVNIGLIVLAVLAPGMIGLWAIVAALGIVTFLIFWMLKSKIKRPVDGQSE